MTIAGCPRRLKSLLFASDSADPQFREARTLEEIVADSHGSEIPKDASFFSY